MAEREGESPNLSMYPDEKEGGTKEMFVEMLGEGTDVAVVVELGRTTEGREDDVLLED